MRKKNYWKECCLLLIGIFIGTFYERNYNFSLPGKTRIDTLKIVTDTITAKVIIPPLNEENVLAELKKQNVPHANIVLAQSKLETGHFTSKICKTHNNIFGIRKNNKYKRYSDFTACIADYKKRISSKYKGGDYYAFLKKLGYAEDPEYTEKLKNIV